MLPPMWAPVVLSLGIHDPAGPSLQAIKQLPDGHALLSWQCKHLGAAQLCHAVSPSVGCHRHRDLITSM